MVALVLLAAIGAAQAAEGPLRVLAANPRYFTSDGKRALYLTGSHTWQNLQDCGPADPPAAFDFEEFLDRVAGYNHNFIRLWTWENWAESCWSGCVLTCRPMAFARTGPGAALDGKPRFDLTKFDEEFFRRIGDRVRRAGARGIYVGVMFFQGFSVAKKEARAKGNPWPSHPFHRDNNINGIDGDPNGDGNGYEVHTLADPRITALEEAYVRKVVDATGGAGNVIFEISNESHAGATPWQHHMIEVVREHDRKRGLRRPLWMSFPHDRVAGMGTNQELWDSPAEAISPRLGPDPEFPYPSEPEPADGRKVVLLDSDHFSKLVYTPALVWKAFTRGTNPLLMDGWRKATATGWGPVDPKPEGVRKAMGDTRRFAERIDLARMAPSDKAEECSTTFCLRDGGREALVFQPGSGPVTVALKAGEYRYEWFEVASGKTAARGFLTVKGQRQEFSPPGGEGWVLYVTRARAPGGK